MSGAPGVFQEFINDLWYYVSPEGTLDSRQYIYFDPANRELIFFADETQQIFTWQNATPTRYGLYVSTQNISITTLRRFLDIELESLDSIRIRVYEDVRLKIAVGNSWDGSYRRAGTVKTAASAEPPPLPPHIDAVYDSSMGKIRFSGDGVYEIGAGGTVRTGRYAFFGVEGQKLLELRPDSPAEPDGGGKPEVPREVFRVETSDTQKNMILSRVRLGAMGIQDLREGAIPLTPAK